MCIMRNAAGNSRMPGLRQGCLQQLHRPCSLGLCRMPSENQARCASSILGHIPFFCGYVAIFRGFRGNLHRHAADGFQFTLERGWRNWWSDHPDRADSNYSWQRPLFCPPNRIRRRCDNRCAGLLSPFEEKVLASKLLGSFRGGLYHRLACSGCCDNLPHRMVGLR